MLFCDLVGFTPLTETRDPEEVRELLSRYFDVARRIIGRYGGIVEKFIGDAVMAVWGTPVADEGDAERAIRAALDLVDAVAVLGGEVGAPDLSARSGVVTGEVAVTLGAPGEGMVAGDAVNTAARVQAVADAGTVLCDATTRKLAELSIAFEEAGAHELKGKTRPEVLHRAVRVLSGVGGKQRAGGLEAPFVGRDAELRTLKDLFHTATERSTPRLVVVSGPAGVGKSRLGWEFEKYIDGIADTVLWHRGRCLSYGEGVAFWALAEIVRQRFGIAEEDPTGVAAAKLEEGMRRFVPDGEEREYVGVRLSRLLGVPYPGTEPGAAMSQDELYAGWRLFFERLAQVAPVAMLVEDAHHADDGLLAFISHLIDWTRDLPIFVLLFARPGLEAIDSGFGVGRNRSTLSLDPMDDASMRSLVDALVPGLPASVSSAVTSRAQGIPLFAVETVRSLVDQGTVQRDGDAYRLAGDLGELSVPGSLHALLAARLDSLPAEVRGLAADASVLGTSFPKEALVAVAARASGVTGDAVQAGLAELVRRDVLAVFADPLSPQRGAYRFTQEMLRQVAYDTLSRRDRKTRHLAVAAHLRSAFANDGEELADAIARHYLDALAAGPNDDDAGQTTAEALGFLVRAAERAARAGASSRAAESYAAAAGIAGGREAPVLFERAAEASADAGRYGDAITHAGAARQGYLDLGDERAAARAQSLKGNALRWNGDHSAARVELVESLGVLRPVPDTDALTALGHLAALELFGGNEEEGDRLTTEALLLAQALGAGPGDLATAFILKGIAASFNNRRAEGAAYQREAARLAERAGDLRTLARAQLNLASEVAAHDPEDAVQAARSAAAHARRTGQFQMVDFAIGNVAVALMEMGEWDAAESAVREVLETGDVPGEGVLWAAGSLAGLRGDGARVASALDLRPELRDSDDVQTKISVGLLDAMASLCAGDLEGALRHAMAVVGHEATGLGSENVRWAWPLAARAARELGDRVALDALLTALDAHPVGHLPPVLRAERDLVRALVGADEGASGGGVPAGAGGGGVSGGAASGVMEAVTALRAVGNPYQLGHGLCDYAEVVVRSGPVRSDADGDHLPAGAALAEAQAIGERLGCPPLVARAGTIRARLEAATEKAEPSQKTEPAEKTERAGSMA